ncbi:MAG: hypothetical protein IKM85_08540 [Bacteroidales bacterium]|nr:hypothetical protein [Bacteroidales bacterium]
MDCEAIDRLHLKEAFGEFEVFQRISKDEDWLDVLFECDTRGQLFVYDDADVGHVVYVNDTKGLGRDKVFELVNDSHKEVFLWHIDGVVYKKSSKCDCAVITSDEMEFIEFKTEASNKTAEAIEENYNRASEQLQQIVLDVKARCAKVGVELTSVVPVEAHAVFNPTVPSDSAMKKNISVKFLVKTGIRLSFDNKKVLK